MALLINTIGHDKKAYTFQYENKQFKRHENIHYLRDGYGQYSETTKKEMEERVGRIGCRPMVYSFIVPNEKAEIINTLTGEVYTGIVKYRFPCTTLFVMDKTGNEVCRIIYEDYYKD